MDDFAREEEEEYDSVGSSTSSDLGGAEEEPGANVRRKRTDATLRCSQLYWIPYKLHRISPIRPKICLLSSLGSSDCGRSPLLLALITDGNATDDSGIDSICCDSAVSPSGGSISFSTLVRC